MIRIILTLILALTNTLCFADYSDRGRPSDYQDHHDGPLTYIYLGVGAIIVLTFIVFWIYEKITKHKKQISDALGTIFAGLLIFSGMLLIGKCGETLHNSINSENNGTKQNNYDNHSISSDLSPQNSNNVDQSNTHNHSPQVKYRTIEYYETCNHCYGKGRIICGQCNGTGEKYEVCKYCYGKGYIESSTCHLCNGSGRLMYNSPFGEGKYFDCIKCNGSGRIEGFTCIGCNGSGRQKEICDFDAAFHNQTHYVECYYCSGSGQIKRTRQEEYY